MVCGNALSCLRVRVVYIWVLECDFMTLVFAYPKAVVCDLPNLGVKKRLALNTLSKSKGRCWL